jgi:hypothetical protein
VVVALAVLFQVLYILLLQEIHIQLQSVLVVQLALTEAAVHLILLLHLLLLVAEEEERVGQDLQVDRVVVALVHHHQLVLVVLVMCQH